MRIAQPKASAHFESITPVAGLSFRVHRWSDNLRECEQILLDGSFLPFVGEGDQWHLHREMELTFIERGSALRLVGDSIARFSGPELELLGPHLPHCIQGLTGSTGISVQFHWPLDHPLRALPEFASLAPLWERSRRGLIFAPEVCQRIGARLLNMPGLSAAGRLGELLQALAEIAALPSSHYTVLSSLPFSVREGERHQANIERVIRHVLEHYAKPHPMDEILGLAAMSKSSFAREFRRYTGFTQTEFLNRVRLDHARRLLWASDDSIAAIAYATGFSNLSHFNRQFRRTYGHPPSADRVGKPPG
ncbi:MAG: helix-turn-helix domain-containing protein [Verrucomicrobia bacterium]|nr:helix-turn-helix domain-containing protein [Verrucomicrobiota bacterium]